ncbi:aftiphilin a isoform X1 [Dunckerocampus dactyliophorus]|uniref:aftiphilin a isoform X1 n=1 Tax=Dunckerocampus dactyliophorus TaxID=161453 RepID=UPI002405BE13|nr:aftiphilin a isoform X1 [Dunckerocampus dactyliophorus]
MEPDVIRMYSSSPPPMEDAEEEDDEFGDFGTFSAVSTSVSFTDLDTPTSFNQTQALAATSPPELLNGGGVLGVCHNGAPPESKANGVGPGGHGVIRTSDWTDMKRADSHVNGGEGEVLTNGFASLDIQGSPQSSVHCPASEDAGSVDSLEAEFADFAAFSDAKHSPEHLDVHPSEDLVRDTHRTGPTSPESLSLPAEEPCDTDLDATPRDVDFAHEHTAYTCTKPPLALNGESKDGDGGDDDSPHTADDPEGGPSDERSSETETETETSLGQPLSTDALEEYGDMSTTGSAPSLPFQEETATPADHSQLAEDEEDDEFGDFGDAGGPLNNFDQPELHHEQQQPQSPAPSVSCEAAELDDEFGDFKSPKFDAEVAGEGGASFADFSSSSSFGNFSSAADAGWSAFGEAEHVMAPEEEEEVAVTSGESSWAAFSSENTALPAGDADGAWHQAEPSSCDQQSGRQTEALWSRLEKLFESSFPQATAPPVEDEVVSLKVLLGPRKDEDQPGAQEVMRALHGRVWTQLEDIHEAIGLRHQWGGSYCNKTLLCCLGIDTRNILFTGQKKQPVIVPMYAAGLGMLEPTKEPVKPVSAAEMIASIAQAPAAAAAAPPKTNFCTSDTVQEALPPIQFDWSSSGLTNPLDASGGSFLLNLDFFGPVDDSGSTCSPSIPGVDPELFELTTAKMDSGGASSRVVDAFARLMSTMEKTSTSTRKPRKDENLSEEAAKVIAGLPDLSFMQAKVLMFPTTLTPLASQATPD